MRGLGATIVDPADFPDFAEIRASGNETIVLDTDFKVSEMPTVVPRLLNSSYRWTSITILQASWKFPLG